MKKLITYDLPTLFVATLASSCRSKKQTPGCDKVDKDFCDLIVRNPNSD